MITSMEMKNRYMELYHKMSESKDVEDMMLFGKAEMWVFNILVDSYPDIAEKWLNKIEGICYNNYITKEEAIEIAGKFINQDNTVGPKWSMEETKVYLDRNNYPCSEKEVYNYYALWLTINMTYSNRSNTIVELFDTTDISKIFEVCYKLSLDNLTDKDRPKWIRYYFKL